MSLAAFLLCAGYGQRLRPLTDRIAKPALTFMGQSAVEINKHQIEKLNPDRWLANAHHLPGQIGSLAKALNLEVLFEPEILGTGGCLHNAAAILNQYDSFLVHNADLLHDIDLQDLLSRHQASGAIATLAGISHPHHDTLSCSSDGRLEGIRGFRDFMHGPDSLRFTFSGIALYRREFLNFVGPGCEDIKPYWVAALKAGEKIEVVDYTASSWHDFGTPQGLWEAAKFRMESVGAFSYRYPALVNEKPYVCNEAGQRDLPPGMGNVLVYEGGSFVTPDTKNRILGLDFAWEIKPRADS